LQIQEIRAHEIGVGEVGVAKDSPTQFIPAFSMCSPCCVSPLLTRNTDYATPRHVA
jgi:hypothetical protein